VVVPGGYSPESSPEARRILRAKKRNKKQRKKQKQQQQQSLESPVRERSPSSEVAWQGFEAEAPQENVDEFFGDKKKQRTTSAATASDLTNLEDADYLLSAEDILTDDNEYFQAPVVAVPTSWNINELKFAKIVGVVFTVWTVAAIILNLVIAVVGE
jgi:hypothetical protein